MEFLEDVYEDELIDAFDAPKPEAPSPTKGPATSPLSSSRNPGQPTRTSAQEFQSKTVLKTALYPTFDDTVRAPPAPGVVTEPPSKPAQQLHTREMGVEGVLQLEQPLHAQVYREDELMSTEELRRRRHEIEHEMQGYQERFDRVAQALAGETPHQIEGRKKREEERLERQEKRHEAMETRLQHQIERLEEREERRARIQARHHRASRSPSPNSGYDEEGGATEDTDLSKEEAEWKFGDCLENRCIQ
ncbi:Glutamine--fructose-6-phosphate aminotransferase [Phytophthora cinnamomi]|uniref:Glutamine--fructose-6-phosphate aminotransferase n=1 Tax=Phytophthora cinnamomi TaxID=4785 RepID=UPI002A339EC2|nr:Glutamine--fructose-6-phosphate aminotransferase [Phytophthora cinnamomi]KAJ8576957.1 hypothetical protein ON010_g2249 [Phytophthora cinnamomi]